jgi:hypothetical protein
VYSLLGDSVIVDGQTIETVSGKPENNDFVRYFIDGDEDISTDDTEIRNVQIAFDCVSIQSKDLADDSKVDEMVSQVKELTLDKDNYSAGGWIVDLVSDNGTDEDTGENDAYHIHRRTFNLKIIIEKA